MAVLHRVNTLSTNRAAELTDLLLAEWQQPEHDEPLIIEEAPAAGQLPNHLYVVWSEWADLSPLERSRIILRAYERRLGVDAAQITQITVAMGLTPDEARRIGIDF